MGRLHHWVFAIAVVIACSPAVAVPPPNDNFANAIPIAGQSGSVTGTVIDASVEIGEPPFGCGASVWYEWTATNTGATKLSLGHAGGSLLVYTGSAVNSLALVTRTPLNRGYSNPEESGAFTAIAGTTYHVSVGPLAGSCASGDQFTLRWSPAEGPTNDLFDNPTTI